MKIRMLFVATIVGIIATACNKENVIPEQDDMSVKTPITITATYGGNGAKVSYTESGSNINASWQDGDQLYVVYNNHVNVLTMTGGSGTTSATFSGDITGTPTASSILTCYVKDVNNNSTLTIDNGNLVFSDDAFLNQDGTLASAAKCNVYHGSTNYGDGTNLSCTFGVNTSMMKFTVKNIDDDATETATLTYVSGSTEMAKATFTVASGDNTVYLCIPAGHYSGEQKLVYACATSGTNMTYPLSTTQANFTAGQTYSREVDYIYSTPLTFVARNANSIVKVNDGIQYNKYDGNGWQTATDAMGEEISLTNAGDKVSFRGNLSTCNGKHILCKSGTCYIYGNVMSLLSSTDFATATTLTSSNSFKGFFTDNGSISDGRNRIDIHPSKELVLPATTLTEECYYQMFKECNLTKAPKLPATTMANSCYWSMFEGCTYLTTAPNLPAGTLAEYCYANMFKGCAGLTSAPAELPATTLERYCYFHMFENCSSLTTAPKLPAAELVYQCYQQMFDGCSNLSSITCLATTNFSMWNLSYWVHGVSSTGTFYKAAGVTWPASNSDYMSIPSGWNVVEIQ